MKWQDVQHVGDDKSISTYQFKIRLGGTAYHDQHSTVFFDAVLSIDEHNNGQVTLITDDKPSLSTKLERLTEQARIDLLKISRGETL